MLQLIVRVVNRIQSMPLNSSLSAVLTGIEVLLSKADAWESLAAKHVSISDCLKPFNVLIIRWRKLELKAWPHLLKVKALDYEATCNRWWFRIYASIQEVLVSSSSSDHIDDDEESTSKNIVLCDTHIPSFASWVLNSSLKDGEKNKALVVSDDGDSGLIDTSEESLFNTLDTFIRGSTVGDFKARLKMIKSFACQLHAQIVLDMKTKNESNVQLISLCNSLYHLHKFYQQFQESFNEAVTTLNEPVETKLKVIYSKYYFVYIYIYMCVCVHILIYLSRTRSTTPSFTAWIVAPYGFSADVSL